MCRIECIAFSGRKLFLRRRASFNTCFNHFGNDYNLRYSHFYLYLFKRKLRNAHQSDVKYQSNLGDAQNLEGVT